MFRSATSRKIRFYQKTRSFFQSYFGAYQRLEMKSYGKTNSKIKLFLALAMGSIGLGVNAASAPASAYQQAITNARAGRFDAALPMLERLVLQNPNTPLYRYDWVAVLSWSSRHADALTASEALGLTAQIPDYVVSAIGKSALHGGLPQRAETAYRSLLARHPRDTDAAQGLTMSLQAQQIPMATWTVAPPAPPAAVPRDWPAEQARNSTHIRAAMGVLESDFTPARFAPMDMALAENTTLAREAATANQVVILRRLRLDHIVGSQARGASLRALNEFNGLETEGDPLPAYALNAAADALMSLRQPGQARILYQRALVDDPGNGGTQTGLMYAELEAENFAGMEQIVQQRLEATQRSPAARRTEVLAMRFSDRLQPAAVATGQLSSEFPDDAGLWLDQADLLSQRGLPRAAAERYRAVLAAEPASIKARVGLADAVWAQGDILEAAQRVAALQAEAPEHPAVQRLVRAWQGKQRPFLTSSATWSFGSGHVAGNDDMARSTTLYSGQSNLGLRLFTSHYLARAQWWDSAHQYQGSASHARGGVGLEWTGRDLQATVEVGTDLRNGRDAVGAAGASWQPNDQWSVRARFETETNDFPLKGRRPDAESYLAAPTYLHADKKTVGVAYRWNESRRVATDLSSYRFNDGNHRSALAASWSERLYSGYGHMLDLQTAAYTSANSLRDAVYFNPKRDFSLSETLAANWLTWRHYERSFKQRVALSAGLYRQQSGDGSASRLTHDQTYGWNPFYGVYYAHEWQFGTDRSLRYGIGARRFPYDGKYENNRYIDTTLNWKF